MEGLSRGEAIREGGAHAAENTPGRRKKGAVKFKV